jgi:periplasmic protein TonB
MSLSDLTLPGMEQYGGIDLKKNYRKYFGGGLGISVGLHLLILLLYVGYNWFTAEEEVKVPKYKVKRIADLAPPPSVTEEVQQAVPLEAPPPGAEVKPNFGIPVPVPEAIAVADVMPDMNNMPVGDVGPGDAVGVIGGEAPVENLVIQQPVEESDPNKDDWIEVSEEPKPVMDIQKLVVYPDFAKRTGIEGKVTVSALIGEDGRVKKVEVEKSDNNWLEEAAKEAMMKARFTPARQGDKPVKVWYTQTIQFKLNAGQ